MDRLRALNSVAFSGRDISPGSGGGSPQYATDGVPGTTSPTQWPAYMFNMMQDELINVITLAGMTPSDTSWIQLYQAILALRKMADTGAADAYAATPPTGSYALPALASIPDGFTIDLLIANDNLTTTPTFAYNGGSAITITDELGAALNPGDLVTGRFSTLTKSGGGTPKWLLRNPRSAAAGTAGLFVRLTASVTSAGTSVSFTADEITTAVSLGGASFQLGNFSATFNGGTTGANGMDTGSLPTSGFVSLYAIFNPTTKTTAILGTTASQTTIYSGSHMPAGYTASALIAIWPTNSSAQLIPGSVVDRKFYYIGVTSAGVLLNGNATSLTSVSLSGFVPAGARTALIVGGLVPSTPSYAAFAMTSTMVVALCTNRSQSGQAPDALIEMPMVVPQTMYYYTSGAGTNATAQVQGYSI